MRGVGEAQRLVARVFAFASLLAAFRDLSTSDSRFGNHLYKGEQTLVFVFIDLVFALAFGLLATRRVLDLTRAGPTSAPFFMGH
jgi:hypothetical protein